MSLRNLKHTLGLLLGLLLLAAAPGTAQADWLGFRNDTKQPVIVRVFTITPDGLRPTGIFKLFPGEVRWDLVKDNASRQIIVSDANPPRKALAQKQIEAPGRGDALYGIQPRPGPQGVGPSVDLVKVPGKRQ